MPSVPHSPFGTKLKCKADHKALKKGPNLVCQTPAWGLASSMLQCLAQLCEATGQTSNKGGCHQNSPTLTSAAVLILGFPLAAIFAFSAVCCIAGASKAGLKTAWGQAEIQHREDVPLASMTPSLLSARVAPLPEPSPSRGSSSRTIPALSVLEPQQELSVMCLPLTFSSGDSGLHEILCKSSQLSHLLSLVPTAGPCHLAPADNVSMLPLLWPYFLQLPRVCGDSSHDLTC